MPVPDFAQHVAGTYVPCISHGPFTAPPKAKPSADAHPGDGFSFDDALDIVNPLQHLPIVGTLYRHLTGDQIKPLEKVAGDTLYGGPIGLLGSLADLAFEKITGKNFGDTLYAFAFGDDAKPAVASASSETKTAASAAAGTTMTASTAASTAAPTSTAASASGASAKMAGALPSPVPGMTAPGFALDNASLDALSKSLSQDGVDGDLSERALDAYRRTMAMDGRPAIPPTPIH